MERDKQYIEHSNEENWTEEQEREYWHKVNKRHDAREGLEYLSGLSSMDIVEAIATAKGYAGTDIFKDCTMAALEYENATNTFLNEVTKLANRKRQKKPTVPIETKARHKG